MENALDLMRSGIDACQLGLVHASIRELSPDALVVPAVIYPAARRLRATSNRVILTKERILRGWLLAIWPTMHA